MRMLRVNDIIEYAEEGAARWVVLFLGSGLNSCFWLDLTDPSAWPVTFDAQVVEADLDGGRALLRDANLAPCTRVLSTPAQISARERRWRAIEKAVQVEPLVYDPAFRASFIREGIQESGLTRNSVVTALQLYWRGGKTPQALTARFDKCGAPGVQREPGQVKRGRPRSITPGTGVNINRQTRRVFDLALRRWYAANRKMNLGGAYKRMVREQYCVVSPGAAPGQESAAFAPGVDKHEIPTEAQFRDHYRRYGDPMGALCQRMSPRRYALTQRGLPGRASTEAWGPGSRYLIDATICDVYLRSRIDRRRIVGRPVLYVVIDVFSEMIVGVYVGIENPSWVGASMALANAGMSKVEFCAEYGITIDEEEWPCRALGARLEADQGEVDRKVADNLVNWFGGIKVERATAYRGDWKGLVEVQFRLLPAEFAPYVPGYIEPDYRERGARDYRLDGVLDVHEFTKIILEIVLYRNNSVVLEGFKRPDGMVVSSAPAIPRDIWNWGISNRSGRLVERPDWYTRFHLLPTTTATMDERGLRFEGNHYLSDGMLDRRWLDRARQKGRWKETISFDPRFMDVIYLHDAKSECGYEVCTLSRGDAAFAGYTLRELQAEQLDNKIQVAEKSADQLRAHTQLTARIESIVEGATAKVPDDERSDAARTANIRENRSQERIVDRRREGQKARLPGAELLLTLPPASDAPSADDVFDQPTILQLRSVPPDAPPTEQ